MRLPSALVLAAILAAAFAGPASAQQTPLTIYSSLPLHGESRPDSVAIVNGARLALEERGHQAGGHPIRYVSLPDSTSLAEYWTPERALANAQRAARDRSAIAYIGEFNSGASAISIPILNEVPLAQISPANTAVGLTRGGPGTHGREPSMYYPDVKRHFVRLVPHDRVQGAALATAMHRQGCRRIAAITDGEVYGTGVGAFVRRTAQALGLDISMNRHMSGRASHYRGLAATARRKRVDCSVFTGIALNNAAQLFEDLGRALPRAKLLGSDGVAYWGFADPRQGGIERWLARRVFVSSPQLAPEAYPEPGRRMFDAYRRRFGESHPSPYAIYGYEAMQLALDAVTAAGADRRGVIDWLFSVRDRESVLGRYSIDGYGDTTTRDYGIYRIARGSLRWAYAVRAAAGP